MMRRDPRDDFDTELVRRLFHFRRRVWIHGCSLARGVVYDEIRIVVLLDGDWNDPHVGFRGGREVEPSCCDCGARPAEQLS